MTGFVSLLYLTNDVLRQIMETDHPQPVRAEHVRLFVPGEPIENLFMTIGVRPGLDSTTRRQHGSHLITGTFDVLEDFAKKGMPVKKLYATSRTTEGIKLCRDLGFKETQLTPEDETLRFELDPVTSDSPFLKKYQQAMKWRTTKARSPEI